MNIIISLLCFTRHTRRCWFILDHCMHLLLSLSYITTWHAHLNTERKQAADRERKREEERKRESHITHTQRSVMSLWWTKHPLLRSWRNYCMEAREVEITWMKFGPTCSWVTCESSWAVFRAVDCICDFWGFFCWFLPMWFALFDHYTYSMNVNNQFLNLSAALF